MITQIKNGVIVVIALIVCLNVSSFAIAEDQDSTISALISNDKLTGLLHSHDSNAAYNATFIATVNMPLSPSQGQEVLTCKVCRSTDTCVMEMDSDYEHPPVISEALGSENRLHGDNIFVRRAHKKYSLFLSNTNAMLEEGSVFAIGPDGIIRATNTYSYLFIYPIGNEEDIHLYNKFCYAVGRGFGRSVESITASSKQDTASFEVITAQGTLEHAIKGTWVLTIDPTLGHLVREANFTREHTTTPVFTVINSGLMDAGNVKIATSSSLFFGGLQAHFEAIDLKCITRDSQLFCTMLKNVTEHINNASTNAITKITDFRKFRNNTPTDKRK